MRIGGVIKLSALIFGFLVLTSIGASAVPSYIVPSGLHDISEVPRSFFVSPDGSPNVKIVVGSFSSANDVASAADIAAALGSILYREEEAKDISVRLRKAGDTSVVFRQVIYRYDYDTMTSDHNLPYNGGLVGWARSYDELPANYWYNGVKYTGNYSTWAKSFHVSLRVKNGDSVNGNSLYGWDIEVKGLSLLPRDPANWNGTAPPKKADIGIPPRGIEVSVDYRLYNYTVTYEKTVREAYSEWGVPAEREVVNETRIGNLVDVLVDTGGNSSINSVVSPGVQAGDEFTLLRTKYHVFSVGVNNFTAGEVLGTGWFAQNETKLLGDRWKITLIGADPLEQKAIVTVVDSKTGELYGPAVLELGQPEDVVVNGDTVVLQLKLDAISENLILGKIAQISGYSNIRTYASGGEVSYGNQEWYITVDSDGQYIKSIGLTNANELVGNPLGILGVYTFNYSFEMRSLNERDVDYDINQDGNVTDTSFVVANASITITENAPVIHEVSVPVGGTVPGTDYVIEGVEGVKRIIIHTPTEPIAILDREVNLENPTSNYILVGSSEDNILTAMIFGHYHLPADFRVWFGNYPVLGYIPKCSLLKGRGVIVVAGSSPEVTRKAAVILMRYIAGLS